MKVLGLSPGDVPPDDVESARESRQRRAFIAARSRYVEDELARLVARGVDQYVVLGAGLDTFACRNSDPRLRVFEVDHPATQAWKRERLASTGIMPPASLTFTPIDFERQSLLDVLSRAGVDQQRPALFGWLGVVAYLGEEAVFNTFSAVTSCAAGTTIVFDYALPPDRLPERARARFDLLAGRVAAAGEPWRTFFEPADIAARLRAIGFTEVEDVNADVLNQRYFLARNDGLRIEGLGRLAHIACARV